jgi:hypothetical protein
MEPILVDKENACRILAVGISKLYQLIATDEIEIVHIGRATRITTASMYAYVGRLEKGYQAEQRDRMRQVVRGLPIQHLTRSQNDKETTWLEGRNLPYRTTGILRTQIAELEATVGQY